jgi:hypothetical protein
LACQSAPPTTPAANFANGVKDTGGKFAASVNNDTGGKFATGGK